MINQTTITNTRVQEENWMQLDKPMVWFHVSNHTWIGTWNTKMALEEWPTMTKKRRYDICTGYIYIYILHIILDRTQNLTFYNIIPYLYLSIYKLYKLYKLYKHIQTIYICTLVHIYTPIIYAHWSSTTMAAPEEGGGSTVALRSSLFHQDPMA